MSEKEGLTKDSLLEVQALLKSEFAEMRKWMEEKFVCKIHCGQRRGKINIWLVLLSVGLSADLSVRTLQVFRIFPG